MAGRMQESLDQTKQGLVQVHGSEQSVIYERLFGAYWLMEDQLKFLCQDEENSRTPFTLKCKSTEFKKAHLQVKTLLKKAYADDKHLTRSEVFPCYLRELRISQLAKKLDSRETLSIARINELESKLLVTRQSGVQSSELFDTYLSHFLNEDDEIVADLLSLVESFYMPQVQRD